jgi:hypothetical protein
MGSISEHRETVRSQQLTRGDERSARRCLAREHRPTYGTNPDDGRDPAAVEGQGHEIGSENSAVTASAVSSAVRLILAADRRQPVAPGELGELAATLRAVDRLSAHAVALARQLDGRRAAAEEGMTVDAALRLHTGAGGPDVAMVLTAAEVLGSMPATSALFTSGVLSWGHVRALVTGARRLDTVARTALDDHLGANREQLVAMDPDRRSWAIEDALDDHRPDRTLQRRADRDAETEFLSAQGRLDGSGTLFGSFAPESFATILAGLEAEADAPRARPSPGDQDGPAEAVPGRAQQLAAALLRLCARPGGAGGSAPVRFSVVVDVDRITDRAAGHIERAARQRPPRLVRRALDRLACDAALDVVVRDGSDLLAAQRYAPEVTAATRRAVAVRDGGCRFPSCTAPVSWCDVHHVQPRAAGGDHAVSNLVLLCRRHHTTVHRRGWDQTLHDDGTYTLRRRGRAWTTLPRRDQQLGSPAREGPAPPPAAGAGPSAPPGAGPSTDVHAARGTVPSTRPFGVGDPPF